LSASGFRFRRRDGPGLHHGLQHDFLPLLGSAEIARRRELRGRAHQPGQHRILGQREFAGLLAEISPGGCVHAVGAGSEIGRVQVAQENVFLLELAFQPYRKHRFLDLAAERPFRRKKHQACKLLGDRAPALPRAAGLGIPPTGPQYSPGIDAVVLVEPSIFDCDDRLRQMRRQIRSCQLVPFEYPAAGENVALGAFEGQGALGGFNLKATSDRQRRDAVEHETDQNAQPRREECRQIFRTKFR
jgi:hypothetical protein